MIKILQFTSLKCGGAESVLLNYYKHINKKKVQFDFLIFSNQEEFYEKDVLNLGGTIYKANPYDRLRSGWKLLKQLNRNQSYAAIEIHTENAHSVLWVFLAKLAGYKNIIVHSHSTNNVKYIQHQFSKFLLNMFPIIRFACATDASKFMFGNRNSYLVNNAVDVFLFSYNEDIRTKMRKQLSVERKTVIGHVGRFIELKNHKLLLEVCKEFIDVGENIVLLLLGDGELKKQIEDKATKMGIDKSVIFTGNVKNVNDYLQAMDIFVLPSYYEGLPTVAIEAQAAGLKCLLSKRITKETDKTGLVDFLDINLSPKVWKDKINIMQNYNRQDTSALLRNKGLDICYEAEKLSKIYELIGEKHVHEIYQLNFTDSHN